MLKKLMISRSGGEDNFICYMNFEFRGIVYFIKVFGIIIYIMFIKVKIS